MKKYFQVVAYLLVTAVTAHGQSTIIPASKITMAITVENNAVVTSKTIVLLNFTSPVYSSDVMVYMDQNGLKPATLHDFISLNASLKVLGNKDFVLGNSENPGSSWFVAHYTMLREKLLYSDGTRPIAINYVAAAQQWSSNDWFIATSK